MTDPKDQRQHEGGHAQRDRSQADDRLIDSNKPTPGQAEGERDTDEQSESNRDEGGRTDRADNL